jgi:hypothetical protein
VLSLKNNGLHADGGKTLAEGLKGNTVITALDISENDFGVDSGNKPDLSGVITLANVIPDMRAMTGLNLASNSIKAKGAKHIAGALKV